MMRAISSGTVVFLAVGAAFAQASDVRPAYEAASIKVNTSASNSSSSHGSPGQVVMTNLTLQRLIERAYGVKAFQVSGPRWMETVRFDIAAKYPPDTKSDDRSMMLRTLLEDRFKLTVHRESKDLPGFALVVAKGGIKLKPVEASGSGSGTDHNGGRVQNLKATQISMAGLADFVARILGETVVNKTGIDGVYDFELHWTNEDQPPDGVEAAQAPSLYTALQETVGVRLQPQKVPVEIIVVDHVERTPIEN